MLELSEDEFEILRSQIGTSSWGGNRHPPFAFTEHGAVMLATILNTPEAVEASKYIVRAFVQFRELVLEYEELKLGLEKLEHSTKEEFKEHREKLERIFRALNLLIEKENEPRKMIGYKK